MATEPITARCGRTDPHLAHSLGFTGRFCAGNIGVVEAVSVQDEEATRERLATADEPTGAELMRADEARNVAREDAERADGIATIESQPPEMPSAETMRQALLDIAALTSDGDPCPEWCDGCGDDASAHEVSIDAAFDGLREAVDIARRTLGIGLDA